MPNAIGGSREHLIQLQPIIGFELSHFRICVNFPPRPVRPQDIIEHMARGDGEVGGDKCLCSDHVEPPPFEFYDNAQHDFRYRRVGPAVVKCGKREVAHRYQCPYICRPILSLLYVVSPSRPQLPADDARRRRRGPRPGDRVVVQGVRPSRRTGYRRNVSATRRRDRGPRLAREAGLFKVRALGGRHDGDWNQAAVGQSPRVDMLRGWRIEPNNLLAETR